MKKKSISIISLLLITSIGLTACGGEQDELMKIGKKDVVSRYRSLEQQYNELSTQYDELYNMYQGIQSEEAPTASISITGDGTGRYTFNSVDSKIIFPSSFQYPGSEQTSASGSISIVTNVSVTPGANWICKLNGASLELEHSSGISGTIKIGAVTELYDRSALQTEVLSPWLSGLPPATVTYKNIFLNGEMWGVQATTPTTIDSEDAFLRCGMLAFGDYSMTYVFVYRGEQDTTKDESIVNVLNSIKILGNQLTVE